MLDGRDLYLEVGNALRRPYVQEVLMVEKLSRKDAVSVKVSMQPFLHKKALEKLSETKKIPLSKLKEELEKASVNDPLRTEIYKKMCELSAKGEYKLPTTETERILSLKPSNNSQTIDFQRTKRDMKLSDVEEDELEFSSSSSSSNKQDDIYYGYPEDLDKKLDLGTIKKMIYEVIEFINDPLNPKVRYTRDPLKIFLKYGLDLKTDRQLIEQLYDFFDVQEYTRFNDEPPPPLPPPVQVEELPPGWERRIDPENGEPYYINHDTGQMQLFVLIINLILKD